MSTVAKSITFVLFFICLDLKVSAVGLPRAVTTPSPECIQRCRSCPPTPLCAPGVSLVVDDCGCCKMCARQVGESCNKRKKCDPHKNLYCSYNDVDDEAQKCVAMPGRSCYSGSLTYKNGETFDVGCKIACNCIDGYLACFPQCPTTITAAAPKDCLHPKLVKKPGKCCEEWICAGDRLNNTTATDRRHKPLTPQQRVPSQPIRHRHRVFAAAHRPSAVAVRIRPKDKCQIQTTEWSSCSKTCGWGVSERVTTDKSCKLQKQTRLCHLRPCGQNVSSNLKKGKKCTRTIKSQRRVRYTFSKCHSKVYTPKYCGSCTDGRCCSPKRTATKTIKFTCDDGFHFKKRMMVIKSCECKRQCADSVNEILQPFRRMGGDTWRH